MKQTRIYDFDPTQLAATETAMWRAYYDRRVLALFRLSVRLLQEQLTFSLPMALYNAYRLTRAAFVFKRGRGREDYRKALGWLVPFYRSAYRHLDARWNPELVADLELEWWIIHRHDFGPGQTAKLEHSLADLCAALYYIPIEELADYARHRAQAMILSDTLVQAREKGLAVEPDWLAIHTKLELSYTALSNCLKQVRSKVDTSKANQG